MTLNSFLCYRFPPPPTPVITQACGVSMQVAKTVLKALALPGSFRSFRHQFMSSDSFSNYSVIMPLHPWSLWNMTSYFKARILSDSPDVENKLRNRFSHYFIPLVTVRWLTVMHYFYPYIIGFFPLKATY